MKTRFIEKLVKEAEKEGLSVSDVYMLKLTNKYNNLFVEDTMRKIVVEYTETYGCGGIYEEEDMHNILEEYYTGFNGGSSTRLLIDMYCDLFYSATIKINVQLGDI